MDIFGVPLETITTIALVFVTIIYAIFTLFIFLEQRKNRKDLSKPFISAKPYFIGPMAMYIQIANIGKGSALDIDIKCKTNPISSTKEWCSNFLLPNSETIEIGLDEYSLPQIFNKYKEILIETSYYDIYNTHYTPIIRIDLIKLKDSLQGKGIIYKDDFHQQIEDIKKELHELSNNTRGLDKVERKLEKIDDIDKSLKRLGDINNTLKKIDDINKNIIAIEKTVRGFGPIFKQKK